MNLFVGFFARPIFISLIFLVLSTTLTESKAVTINGVFAPNLARPNDGVTYPFRISVTGTYDRGDILLNAAQTITAEYWDQDRFVFDLLDPDDIIDTTTFVLPRAPVGSAVGTPWGPVSLRYLVGCKTTPEVFGPLGSTGEDPMDDGYFFFVGATNRSWGYNRVDCTPSRGGPGESPPLALSTLSDVPIAISGPSSLSLFVAGLSLLLIRIKP